MTTVPTPDPGVPSATDEALAARLIAGDQRAFESIVLDTSSCAQIDWSVQIKRGPEAPDPGDGLVFEYHDGLATVERLVGDVAAADHEAGRLGSPGGGQGHAPDAAAMLEHGGDGAVGGEGEHAAEEHIGEQQPLAGMPHRPLDEAVAVGQSFNGHVRS